MYYVSCGVLTWIVVDMRKLQSRKLLHIVRRSVTASGVDAVVTLLMLNGLWSVVEQNVVGLLKHLNRLRLDGLQTAVVRSVA